VVDVLGKHLMEIDRSSLPPSVIVGHFVAPVFLLLTMGVVAGSVGSAFRRRDPQLLLLAAISAYFSVMVVFASMYYEMAFAGDLSDAILKYQNYRADALRHADGPRYSDQRTLAGIERRFWSGVDWPVEPGRYPGGLPPYLPSVTTAQMRVTALRPLNAVVRFIPEASLSIFGDCLHLSVTTMTTVGYGDIVPRSLGARFATDSEAVCNTLLLIFGLGIIFGRWRGPGS
jgi:hypothetical protein